MTAVKNGLLHLYVVWNIGNVNVATKKCRNKLTVLHCGQTLKAIMRQRYPTHYLTLAFCYLKLLISGHHTSYKDKEVL